MNKLAINSGASKRWLPPKLLLVMKLTVIIMTTFLCQIYAGTYAQHVTYKQRNASLEDIFKEIRKQTGYNVLVSTKTLEDAPKIDVDFKGSTVENVLKECLESEHYTFIIDKKTILIKKKEVYVENKTVTVIEFNGKVTDEANQPLPGATVTLKGTKVVAITNNQGEFTIKSPSSEGILVISFIGYTTQEVPLGQGLIKVVMKEDKQKSLNEVVVVGYGTMQKSHLTGAVASVKSEALASRPVSDVGQALSGQVAGVEVSAVTKPGATPSIVIRGFRSINYNRGPLYVVDGIPRDDFSDIPVNDVQNVEVLKDAISTAIYGSRAANGVILITTKSGSKSGAKKTEIGYSGYYGINSTILPQLMDGDTYVQLRRDRARWNQYGGAGWSAGAPLTDAQVFTSQEIPTVQNRNYVDWGALLYKKTSTTQENGIDIDNSTENTKVRFSTSYRKDNGYYTNNDFKRLSLGLKIDQNLYSFLKLNLNLRFTNQVTNDVDPGNMQSSNTQTADIFRYINPLVQAYDANGNLIPEVKTPYANPLLDVVNRTTDMQTDNKLFGVISLKANLSKGLTFTSTLGYDARFGNHDIFYPKNSAKRYLVRNSLGAYGSRLQENVQGYTFDNYFNYKNSFNKHTIDATVVSSLQSNVSTYSSETGNMLPDDVLGIWNMSQFTLNKEVGSGYKKVTTASFIGRFQYAFDNKYLAGFSMRRDGSSVLAEGHQWGTFPAASLGWIISNEKFFKSKTISTLKLRTSYGLVGSATIDPYQSFGGIYAARTNFGNSLVTGYTLADLSGTVRSFTNKNLTWETSTTLNLGLDWAMFDGRVSGYIEAYRTITSNLIFNALLPPQTGFTQTLENVGSTLNKGIEFNVSSVNIESKAFKWATDINFSLNRSYIKSLKNDVDRPNDKLFIGQPWRMFYDNTLIGIWQVNDPDLAKYVNGSATNPGELKYKDVTGPNGQPDGIINDLDKTILGIADPKWTTFMRNSFQYKNFSFGIGIIGKFGGLIQMSGRGLETSTYPLEVTQNYWTPTNPTGKYNYLALLNDASIPAVALIRPGDYIRVQELTVNYRIKLLGIKDIRLGVITNNPFYLWRKSKDVIDPSAPNNSYQTSKSVVFKLDVRF